MVNELPRHVREKLDLDPEGKKYLKDIFDGVWLIHNPTNLDISGLGKIVATSTVHTSFRKGGVEEYFTFEQGKSHGEIIRRQIDYYIERYH